MTDQQRLNTVPQPCETDFKALEILQLVSLANDHTTPSQEVVSYLKIAERLLEHAGYSSAGNNRKGDVIELMLLAANIGELAETISLRGTGMRAMRASDGI